ncbi:conserved hypothetical protein [Magnetospirillum sp. LM-5]|uniref:hypothetical protein n=1 Tax=Magnetospirillum sp. LM-5 TaxID=2681466 RepID=UPI001381BB5C|nr:hypothetical protein [Magnetospirillum sp. LM-5]CAA7619109.1 conserved hypothetical protein [Magnetospirillum sp. LM-5]
MPAYRVLPYSPDVLAQLLVEKSSAPSGVEGKAHIAYLQGYLSRLGVRTVLVEKEYIDKHYLEDYVGYYARCFVDYGRKCARLHFFDSAFTEADFAGMLKKKIADPPELRGHYAGFIVVKPLPTTVIGRTCLKTCAEPEGEPHFPANHAYSVNVFGYDLTVTSLAFQEQDSDVAACATSALWSAFQATGRRFQHEIPSPVSITRTASTAVRLRNRTLPNHDGLTAEQIADAIRAVGLEPHAIRVGQRTVEANGNITHTCDVDLFRTAAHAYLSAGIPSLACGALTRRDSGKEIGLHAMTIVGSLHEGPPVAPGQGMVLRAAGIGRLYTHDDGVGPFARLRFTAGSDIIATSWVDPEDRQPDKIQFVPYLLIVPTYHKIRVPFAMIRSDLEQLDRLLDGSRTKIPGMTGRGEWDITLTEAGTLKRNLFAAPACRFDRDILKASLPKYIWSCDFHVDNAVKARFLFDATDILQGNHFVAALCYDDAIGAAVAGLRQSFSDAIEKQQNAATRSVLDWFVRSYP